VFIKKRPRQAQPLRRFPASWIEPEARGEKARIDSKAVSVRLVKSGLQIFMHADTWICLKAETVKVLSRVIVSENSVFVK
jgi:hypothetical protein